MACNHCYHNSVCGSASAYCDSSECKSFVDKDSVVPIEVLHKAQDACEKLREECRDLATARRSMKEYIEEVEDEMRYLRVIKQTLEMASGHKFDI